MRITQISWPCVTIYNLSREMFAANFIFSSPPKGYSERELFYDDIIHVEASANVIHGHRFWYQSKAHIRLPISD